MTSLELMKYRFDKTCMLRDKFLDSLRAVQEYEQAVHPELGHLDKLYYQLLTAVNNVDALLGKQRLDFDQAEEDETKCQEPNP